MPYQHLFRQQEGSHDYQSQHAFQRHQPQPSIVDTDSQDYTGWHEMDFTSTPLPPSAPEMDSHQFVGQKYSPAAMDRDLNPLAYLRSLNGRLEPASNLINHRSSKQQTSSPQRASRDNHSGSQYPFSPLLSLEGNLSSMDESSLNSSRTSGDTDMTNDDLANTLSAFDSFNSSPAMSNPDPIAASIATTSDSTERLCPLIAGQVDSCDPSRCGPDAPCMNFASLPPIEECTSLPCMTYVPPASVSTTICDDGMSVAVHQRQRPSVSTRTSTTTTSRSSTGRRSSSSTTTTIESHPEVVPLSSKRAIASTRRQSRGSKKSNPILKASSSDKDNYDDTPSPSSTRTKSMAPSKTDVKIRAKQAHSLVERKYRENLNAKITQLHITLQKSYYGPRLMGEDLDVQAHDNNAANVANGGVAASKVRKSDVLSEAMNYVNQTEVEMRHMENEINRLGERVRILEKLVRYDDCSALKQFVGLQDGVAV